MQRGDRARLSRMVEGLGQARKPTSLCGSSLTSAFGVPKCPPLPALQPHSLDPSGEVPSAQARGAPRSGSWAFFFSEPGHSWPKSTPSKYLCVRESACSASRHLGTGDVRGGTDPASRRGGKEGSAARDAVPARQLREFERTPMPVPHACAQPRSERPSDLGLGALPLRVSLPVEWGGHVLW